ncbi:hypothetical protein Pdw03_6692 [Penicillium digitatum]|uniref:Uncharacterized protein n=1 Tax=Penicillium digitatum TaxID=36651 RepID=A0A7T6XKH2_PENDI|nr:hypothetical protein Pdw03_6692 [Penicillium digitatum]
MFNVRPLCDLKGGHFAISGRVTRTSTRSHIESGTVNVGYFHNCTAWWGGSISKKSAKIPREGAQGNPMCRRYFRGLQSKGRGVAASYEEDEGTKNHQPAIQLVVTTRSGRLPTLMLYHLHLPGHAFHPVGQHGQSIGPQRAKHA